MLFSLMLQLLKAEARAAPAALASGSNIFFYCLVMNIQFAHFYTHLQQISQIVYSLLLMVILGKVASRDCRCFGLIDEKKNRGPKISCNCPFKDI
jgi:hypothetical protein